MLVQHVVGPCIQAWAAFCSTMFTWMPVLWPESSMHKAAATAYCVSTVGAFDLVAAATC
jgi:hypothetical protein